MGRGLLTASHHCMTAGAEVADDGRWERGQKKCPRDGGRCHCIGGVNSYGAEILIKEEWGEIQVQDAQKKQHEEWHGRRKTERP